MEIVRQRAEGGVLLGHVDENLAEATIGIISGSEVDLLTADARLLGVNRRAGWVGVRVAEAGRQGRQETPARLFSDLRGTRVLAEVRSRLPSVSVRRSRS